jgi:hypothetical protein
VELFNYSLEVPALGSAFQGGSRGASKQSNSTKRHHTFWRCQLGQEDNIVLVTREALRTPLSASLGGYFNDTTPDTESGRDVIIAAPIDQDVVMDD